MDDHYGITDMNEAATHVASLALNDNGQALMDLDLNALASSVVAALGANGYVVVPRHLLDELVDAWTNDGNITRCDNAAQALVAAVVEAVGPTREDTK